MDSVKGHPSITGPVEFAGFRLDSKKRLLLDAEGEPVSLTARAFDTLLFLLEHHGETLSKQQIMAAVWPNAVVEDNNLNQAIYAVRKALGDNQDKQRIILTIPGRGYSFVSDVQPVEQTADSGHSEPIALEGPRQKKPGYHSTLAIRLVIALFVVALLVAGFDIFTLPSVPAKKTIAVLPFINLSSDKDQEYFADGLTEDLLTKLSKIKGLQVTGRASSFYYKGRNDDIRMIGDALGVAYILEGSVQKSGHKLRITAQLIKVEDGYEVWSKSYDREMADIFTIQDEIVKDVSKALSITLGAGEFDTPGMTHNVQAYDLALKAHNMLLSTKPGIKSEMISYAQRAVDLDPSSSVLWLVLHDCLGSGAPKTAADIPKIRARLKEIMAKVRTLTPNKPIFSIISARKDMAKGNFKEAENKYLKFFNSDFKKNLDAFHKHVSANQQYAVFLTITGRVQDALEYARRAQQQDPFSYQITAFLAGCLIRAGKLDEGEAELEKAINLGLPRSVYGNILALIDMDRGDMKALVNMIREYQNSNEHIYSPRVDSFYFFLADLLQDKDRNQALAELRTKSKEPGMIFFQDIIGRWAQLLGDPAWSLQILINRPGTATYTGKWEGFYSPMRRLPGFKTYVKKIGLADYWRVTGKWGDFCRPLPNGGDFECF